MSSGDRDDYETHYKGYKEFLREPPRRSTYLGTDPAEAARRRREAEEFERQRAAAEAERQRRLDEKRRSIASGEAERRMTAQKQAQVARPIDRSLARNHLTAPASDAKRLHLVLVDNSGSNRVIAEHLRESAAYLLTTLRALDPLSQIAFMFFSDHGDGPLLRQDVDWITPNEKGDLELRASVHEIRNACGGDEPEAIECALHMAAELNFGSLPKEARHLYLVTDVVAHGMGMSRDDGCPLYGQDFWRTALREVNETFGTFQLIGTGIDFRVAKLQEQFITDPTRLPFDLIDLSDVPTHQHRCGITGNAVLFLIARNFGPQVVEGFLMALYEKWLAEPLFGENTDLGARTAISRFIRFLDLTTEQKQHLSEKIFGHSAS